MHVYRAIVTSSITIFEITFLVFARQWYVAGNGLLSSVAIFDAMKFGQHLLLEGKPEWREKYLNYNLLKAILYQRLRQTLDDTRETEFFRRCTLELKKINLFYNQKIQECQGKCRALEMAVAAEIDSTKDETPAALEAKGNVPSAWRRFVNIVQRPFSKDSAKSAEATGHQLSPQLAQHLKCSSEEFYFELECLKNYKEDNEIGFRKIMKKHDKLWRNNRGAIWHEQKIKRARFVIDKSVDKVCERVEKLRIQLEGGDKNKAMEKLRVPSSSERTTRATVILCVVCWALFLTIFGIAVLLISNSGIIDFYDHWRPAGVLIRLYRGTCLILLNVTLVACNLRLWQRTGVNYVLIFELDPRKYLTSVNLLTVAGLCWALWAASLVGYVVSPLLKWPRLWFPLGLFIIYLLLMLNPVNFGFRASRFWLLRRIYYCVTAPFHSGTFADFWLADQMASLVQSFLDAHYLLCFYAMHVHYSHGWIFFKISNTTSSIEYADVDFVNASHDGIDPETGAGFCSSNDYGIRPIVSLLPSIIRLMQCMRRFAYAKTLFPHFYNGIKYLSAIPVVIFGSLYIWKTTGIRISPTTTDSYYFHAWMMTQILNFAISYLWDTRVDWRLLDKRTGANPLLRRKLVYTCSWLYYTAAIVNGILRLRWIVEISFYHAHLNTTQRELITTVLSVIECVRRFVWNAFRLENEHLNNVEGLRVSRNVFGIPSRKLADFGKFIKRVPPEGQKSTKDIARKESAGKSAKDLALKAKSAERWSAKTSATVSIASATKTASPLSNLSLL